MMDASLVSSLYLIPSWVGRLLEDFKEEGEESTTWALKLLQEEGRRAVWCFCAMAGVDNNGVPGQACRLLERYLSIHVRELIRLATDDEDWENSKRALTSRIPLLIASCVQLAAKMGSASSAVNAKLVRSCLSCRGMNFSMVDVIASEFNIFSTLGFRLPMWTSVEVAQLLALKVGLPLDMMECVALLVDVAEFFRDRLEARLRDVANPSPSESAINKTSLRTLHLAAGAVVASNRYVAIPSTDSAPRLAVLVRAPVTYLKCVCDIILTYVLVDDSDTDVIPMKRKRCNHT